MAENEDLTTVIIDLRNAKKNRFFGEITLSYRNGEIQYVRKMEVEKMDDLKEKHKTIEKK